MARPFDFEEDTPKQARLRQYGCCAKCGKSLNWKLEHAHHVVPNQVGDPQNNSHAWLKTELNCVILCESCHYHVHEYGRYRNGATALPEYFCYSHGKDVVQHKRWVEDLNLKSQLLWGVPA
jgi:hypothetical protein